MCRWSKYLLVAGPCATWPDPGKRGTSEVHVSPGWAWGASTGQVVAGRELEVSHLSAHTATVRPLVTMARLDERPAMQCGAAQLRQRGLL